MQFHLPALALLFNAASAGARRPPLLATIAGGIKAVNRGRLLSGCTHATTRVRAQLAIAAMRAHGAPGRRGGSGWGRAGGDPGSDPRWRPRGDPGGASRLGA